MSLPSTEQSFWDKAEKIPFHTCWEWIGANSGKQKYGILTFRGKTYKAHRLAWELHNKKEIPYGSVVAHSCDNEACINPLHLWLGTQKENVRDCIDKKRFRSGSFQKAKTHCKSNHEFTIENTWIEKNGSRHCRKCHVISIRRARMRARNKNV